MVAKHYFAGMIAAASMTLTSVAFAQEYEESTNRVSAETDWSVFVEDNPTQCWVVSAPQEVLNTRDGREVSVTRGEILLFVSYWPEEDRMGEVSFRGGYPFAEGSTVTVEIGSATFELFTENVPDAEGELEGYAWPASPQEDQRIITAMKRGADAVLTARSTRGTQTQDTFSLMGFTAAVEDAEARCSG